MVPGAVVEREPGLGQRPGDRTGQRAEGVMGGQRPTGTSGRAVARSVLPAAAQPSYARFAARSLRRWAVRQVNRALVQISASRGSLACNRLASGPRHLPSKGAWHEERRPARCAAREGPQSEHVGVNVEADMVPAVGSSAPRFQDRLSLVPSRLFSPLALLCLSLLETSLCSEGPLPARVRGCLDSHPNGVVTAHPFGAYLGSMQAARRNRWRLRDHHSRRSWTGGARCL